MQMKYGEYDRMKKPKPGMKPKPKPGVMKPGMKPPMVKVTKPKPRMSKRGM